MVEKKQEGAYFTPPPRVRDRVKSEHEIYLSGNSENAGLRLLATKARFLVQNEIRKGIRIVFEFKAKKWQSYYTQFDSRKQVIAF